MKKSKIVKKRTSGIKTLFTKKRLIILTVFLSLTFFVYKYLSLKSSASVQSIKIEKGKVSEELVLSGEVEALNHAQLSFQGSGKLAWVGVKEGDVVKKGQAVAQLDANSLRQQLEQTEADWRYYQAVADRVLDDVKGHDDDETFEQKEDRTQAQAARDKAYRAYEIAKQNISNSVLRAPFEGVVTMVSFPFTGINVTFSETQVEIVDMTTAYFSVSADQTEVTQLNTGDKVEIVLDSFPESSFIGKISYISATPKPGEVGSVYEVKIIFDNTNSDNRKMRIGMSGDAKFTLEEKDGVLYVPSKFIKSDSEGDYLKTNLKNGKEYVKKGIEGEDIVEVEGNISEGQTIFD